MKIGVQSATAALLLGVSLLSSGCEENYASIMSKKIRAALGDDFKSYTFSSYPTDNFGLATAYDPARGKPMSDENFLCATWSCLGQRPEADTQANLTVGGFAEVGGNGALVTLTDTSRRSSA